jgi:hypothetical protein
MNDHEHVVTLSKDERRALADIERRLSAAGPDLARDLSAPIHPRRTLSVSAGIAMLGVGIALLSLGALTGIHTLLLVGLFVAMPFPFPISLAGHDDLSSTPVNRG